MNTEFILVLYILFITFATSWIFSLKLPLFFILCICSISELIFSFDNESISGFASICCKLASALLNNEFINLFCTFASLNDISVIVSGDSTLETESLISIIPDEPSPNTSVSITSPSKFISSLLLFIFALSSIL